MLKNSSAKQFDYVIIGAGFFGMHAADLLTKRGLTVAVIDKSTQAFSRASAINQARLHNGYHYPRSLKTAKTAKKYYDRFKRDFDYAINDSFRHIYAISNKDSKTSAKEFEIFCNKMDLPLKRIAKDKYFKKEMVTAAYLVEECVFDYALIRDRILKSINDTNRAKFYFGFYIKSVKKEHRSFNIGLDNGHTINTRKVLNATYSGINEINKLFGYKMLDVKYEICEMAFGKVPQRYKDMAITVMDGAFFSFMPFGRRHYHSFSSVEHTPHKVVFQKKLKFKNLKDSRKCEQHHLKNCSICSMRLETAWDNMVYLCTSYLKDPFDPHYLHSRFEIKAILKSSERTDSRPTVIKIHSKNPSYISVLAGKIDNIYDLDKVL
jgi:hypothetical protein